MAKFKGNTMLARIVRSRYKYEDSIKELEDYLRDKIGFHFAIDFQHGDGHMIVDIESGMNIATVAECLSVIYMKGSLSREDHKSICI